MGVQRSLQRLILKSSLDVSARKARTQIAVSKDVYVGRMALHPHGLFFVVCWLFLALYILGCAYPSPLAVQLGSCRLVLGAKP